MFPDHASAFKAGKGKSQARVDNAHTRCFIAPIPRPRDEGDRARATEELG